MPVDEGRVQDRCLWRAGGTERIGAPCPNCAHTNLVHGNLNNNVEACPICDTIIAQQVFASLIEDMATALGAAPGSVVIPRSTITRPPPLPPLRCQYVAGTGARCKRATRHDGQHAYNPGFMEPRPYSWATPGARTERVKKWKSPMPAGHENCGDDGNRVGAHGYMGRS